MRRTFWLALCLFLLMSRTFAQTVRNAPLLLNYQGRLAKPDGTPVPDGNYSLRFALHSAATGNTELWSQAFGSVAVKNGTFAVLLDTTSGPATLWNDDLWLEIKIGTDTPLTPRQRLVSVAFAMKANNVPDNSIVTARLADNAVTTAKIVDSAITTAKLANNAVTAAKLADSSINAAKIATDPKSLSKMTNSVLALDGNNNFTLNPRSIDAQATSTVLLRSVSDTVTLQSGGDTKFLSGNGFAFNAADGGFTVGTTKTMNFTLSGTSVLRLDDITKRAVVRGLEITGGADVAEPFAVRGSKVKPGYVVSIDPRQTGGLRLAARAYDRTVAGVISGAGGVRPGLTLTQEGSVASGKFPVAMTGRVWVWCDAEQNGSVKSGDLLTASATPGHAMRVTDYRRAPGAVIGKAMSSLQKGRGLVLVLVNLQ